MLTVVKNYWRFFKKSIRCNLSSVLEYKKSFIIQSIFMMFNNFFFLIFWIVVFNANGGNIEGITMNDILYLWSIPVIAYGVSFFFFGGTRNLGKFILEGGLDSYLTQPKNVIISVMFSAMDFGAFGDLVYGLGLGLFAVEFNIWKYLLLISFGLIGAVFFICTQVLIRLLTIWVGNTDDFERVYTNTLLITFANYPESIYNNVIKFLIYTVIPSAYVSFVPIKFINTLDIKYLITFLAVGLVYILMTAVISKRVLEKYESGNNITLKE